MSLAFFTDPHLHSSILQIRDHGILLRQLPILCQSLQDFGLTERQPDFFMFIVNGHDEILDLRRFSNQAALRGRRAYLVAPEEGITFFTPGLAPYH